MKPGNRVKKLLTFVLLWLLIFSAAIAQSVTGTVTNATDGTPVPFANVFYDGDKRGVQTDEQGRFSIAFRLATLHISNVGFDGKEVRVTAPGHLDVRLRPNARLIGEASVTGRRSRYSRKNNPAVAMMRKVIAAKQRSDLSRHDYYSIDKYSKLTFAFNEVTDNIFQEGSFKNMPFLKDHVETCNATGKLILPVSVDETVSRDIYRKSPESLKTIVLGRRNEGLNDMFNTGEIMTTLLKDCFTDIDIYQDNIRLLQETFISPISSSSAIRFYRYFIEDTLRVDNEECFRLTFTPNNPQDIGFTGTLYVAADSTWRIKRVDMGVPRRSDVNFVDAMSISQQFERLPSGEQVMVSDDMLVQLKIVDFVQKFQVRRTTQYSHFSFAPIPDRDFRFKGHEIVDADAQIRDEAFWQQHRSEQLTDAESKMGGFIKSLRAMRGFNPVLFVAKALIENHVETSADPDRPSKFDIGPINTIISQNFVDGLRLRASAQTTANLHPHLFARGYVAYGFKDHRWKGLGEATWSFNRKHFLPREFPVNNLTFTYSNDVMSPSDKFLPTDKDNVFVSFKWTTVDHMMYYETFRLLWDREWANGLRLKLRLSTERDEPTAALFYQPLDAAGMPSADKALHRRSLRTTDLMASLTYQPGVTWMNTKQRRIPSNNDAPIFSVAHTAGLKGVLGSDYTYNLSEASARKRFQLADWGSIDAELKAGAQWNRVPFPLLIMPAANLSYIKETGMFSLMDNMEFLNDRYASLMFSWDMKGKIFNRIPLLRRLKWREHIGCNLLWGTLTDKNNPFLARNAADASLFYFPGTFQPDGSYRYTSGVMNPRTPYVELSVGIHNIFKVLHLEYTRRLTYIDNPDTHRWGLRAMLRLSF